MKTSENSGSLLVIDVGSISTRAIFFDVVDGKYRYIASGSASTTDGAPFHNISEGVCQAIDQLSAVTGKKIIDSDEQLIIPSTPDGSGVDHFAALISVGPPIKVVTVGLLGDISVESATNLARTIYSEIDLEIGLNDRMRTDQRITSIVQLSPDLIIFAGGTEGGASKSILNILEGVALASYLMPKQNKLKVLYVGNQEIKKQIQKELGPFSDLYFAPNIHPALEIEQLDVAKTRLSDIFSKLRTQQIRGVEEMYAWSNGNVMPNSLALGRVIRYLSHLYTTKRGVLGIDVAASATTMAASFDGGLEIGVYPELGLGRNIDKLLEHISIQDITRWLTIETPEQRIYEYVLNKSYYPQSLPALKEEMEIEQALARAVINKAAKKFSNQIMKQSGSAISGLLPFVDPIIATGSVLTNSPSLAQCILTLLDGLQPIGSSFLVLDKNHIASALGVAASINPLLTVQVLDSNAFVYLGTVISPVGRARIGTPILRLKLVYSNGQETNMDVNYGTFEILPLSPGQSADLHLQPLQKFDIGMGAPGRGGILRHVMGGVMGVMIDARGRPLPMIRDHQKRAEFYKRWLTKMGDS
jgi:hypothetical protein